MTRVKSPELPAGLAEKLLLAGLRVQSVGSTTLTEHRRGISYWSLFSVKDHGLRHIVRVVTYRRSTMAAHEPRQIENRILEAAQKWLKKIPP